MFLVFLSHCGFVDSFYQILVARNIFYHNHFLIKSEFPKILLTKNKIFLFTKIKFKGFNFSVKM